MAAAVDRDLVSLYPVQTVCRHFDVVFGCFVFGLRSLAFQKITLGIESFVFHYWGSFVPATAVGFAMDIRRITADRDIVPISYGASPFHQICRVQKYRKNAFVRLVL